jgi:hypothetical protein
MHNLKCKSILNSVVKPKIWVFFFTWDLHISWSAPSSFASACQISAYNLVATHKAKTKWLKSLGRQNVSNGRKKVDFLPVYVVTNLYHIYSIKLFCSLLSGAESMQMTILLYSQKHSAKLHQSLICKIVTMEVMEQCYCQIQLDLKLSQAITLYPIAWDDLLNQRLNL